MIQGTMQRTKMRPRRAKSAVGLLGRRVFARGGGSLRLVDVQLEPEARRVRSFQVVERERAIVFDLSPRNLKQRSDGDLEALNPQQGDRRPIRAKPLTQLLGSPIHAPDGKVGALEDILLENREWRVLQLIVRLENPTAHTRVRILPTWIESIDPSHGIALGAPRDGLAESPKWPVDRTIDCETVLRMQEIFDPRERGGDSRLDGCSSS